MKLAVLQSGSMKESTHLGLEDSGVKGLEFKTASTWVRRVYDCSKVNNAFAITRFK